MLRLLFVFFFALVMCINTSARELKSEYVQVASDPVHAVLLDSQGEVVLIDTETGTFSFFVQIDQVEDVKLFVLGEFVLVQSGNIANIYSLDRELLAVIDVESTILDVAAGSSSDILVVLASNGVFTWDKKTPGTFNTVVTRPLHEGQILDGQFVCVDSANTLLNIHIQDFSIVSEQTLDGSALPNRIITSDSEFLLVYDWMAYRYNAEQLAPTDSLAVAPFTQPIAFSGDYAFFSHAHRLIRTRATFEGDGLDTLQTNVGNFRANVILDAAIQGDNILCVGQNRYVSEIHVEQEDLRVLSYFTNSRSPGFVRFNNTNEGFVATYTGLARTQDGGCLGNL